MKTSFSEILNNNVIIIPILQRDYVQGRTDDKTTRIRKDFLDAVFQVIEKKAMTVDSLDCLQLDFIYGFSKKQNEVVNFYPIDGQQRLTTLWLLWWFVAAKEQVQHKTLLSRFRYETRHSTTVFLEKLVAFNPSFNSNSIAEEVTNQSWYFETWDYDPGIRAMLVTLDQIEKRYEKLGVQSIWEILNNENSPFYFYKLDMEKVGLPDDLYIKMNSRGKLLTDFEYFKANFSEVIPDETMKQRFHNSIDQQWSETIWKIVFNVESKNKNRDIASTVDACFMRLINFITDVIAYKNSMSFTDIASSAEDVKLIYQQEDNLRFLFDVLDSIVHLENNKPGFWDDLFYIQKADFSKDKTRLFFQNSDINLLQKCLFTYVKNGREFPFGEQLLLYACMIHWLNNTGDFSKTARIVRNLVANSTNELRFENIGDSFSEIEILVLNEDLNVLQHFKTDQITEEKAKLAKIKQQPSIEEHLYKLEDSDLLRGCISLFDIDERFISRKNCFLDLFDEDAIVTDFESRANLLLCFGDYTQDDGDYTNVLAKSKANWRTFFTTPSFNKAQLTAKTKTVLMECLDYYISHERTPEEIINDKLKKYDKEPKDWKFYFLKYHGFREECNKGYYYWDDNHSYPKFKMNQKQFNGYHWDPFLLEAKKAIDHDSLELNYGDKMQLIINDEIYEINNTVSGFVISNRTPNKANDSETTYNLVSIEQTAEGIDLEDRVEKLIQEINRMLILAS